MTKKQLGLFQREMNDALSNKRTDEMRQMVYGNSALISTTREKGIITMTLRFPVDQFDAFQKDLRELSAGRLGAEVIETTEMLVPVK